MAWSGRSCTMPLNTRRRISFCCVVRALTAMFCAVAPPEDDAPAGVVRSCPRITMMCVCVAPVNVGVAVQVPSLTLRATRIAGDVTRVSTLVQEVGKVGAVALNDLYANAITRSFVAVAVGSVAVVVPAALATMNAGMITGLRSSE